MKNKKHKNTRNSYHQIEREQPKRQFVFVKDKKWCAFLTFYIGRDDKGAINKIILAGSELLLLNVKGPYRESNRAFETFYNRFPNPEILTKEEAKVDIKFIAIQDYLDNIEKRVALFWEERKDQKCSEELVPPDEKIPEEDYCQMIPHDERISGFENGFIIFGNGEFNNFSSNQ